MLKKVAIACLVAGFMLPFLTTLRAFSRSFVAQSGGDTAAASESIAQEMPWLLSVNKMGFVLIGTGVALFFAARRPG